MGLSIGKEYLIIPSDHPIRKTMHVQVSAQHPVPVVLDDRHRFDVAAVKDLYAYMQRKIKEEMNPARFRPVDQWLQLNNASDFTQGFLAPYQSVGGHWWQFGSIQVPLKLGPRPAPGVKDERIVAVDYHYLVAKHCIPFTTDVHSSVVDQVKGVKTFTGLMVVGPMVRCQVLAPMPDVMNWLTVRTVTGNDVPIA